MLYAVKYLNENREITVSEDIFRDVFAKYVDFTLVDMEHINNIVLKDDTGGVIVIRKV